MSTICGFGGFPTNEPNQSFRFVVPIFLHAGIVRPPLLLYPFMNALTGF